MAVVFSFTSAFVLLLVLVVSSPLLPITASPAWNALHFTEHMHHLKSPDNTISSTQLQELQNSLATLSSLSSLLTLPDLPVNLEKNIGRIIFDMVISVKKQVSLLCGKNQASVKGTELQNTLSTLSSLSVLLTLSVHLDFEKKVVHSVNDVVKSVMKQVLLLCENQASVKDAMIHPYVAELQFVASEFKPMPTDSVTPAAHTLVTMDNQIASTVPNMINNL